MGSLTLSTCRRQMTAACAFRPAGVDVKRTSRTAAVDVAVGRIPVVRGSCAYVRVGPEVKSFRGEFESRVCLTHLLTLEGFRLNTPNLIEPNAGANPHP
jgi:hypothetical protein